MHPVWHKPSNTSSPSHARRRLCCAAPRSAAPQQQPPPPPTAAAPAAATMTAAAQAEAADAAAQQQQQQQPLSNVQSALAGLALSSFVGSILAAALLQLVAGWLLLTAPGSPWTWSLLATLVLLYVWPLPAGRLGRAFSAYCCATAPRYFGPARIVVQDGAVFHRDRPYIVGLEPHSALPTAMPTCFGLPCRVLPEGLRGRTHGLASSICFYVPLVRHLYWWWGIRPITRHEMRRLLGRNKCVVLVPGGVQECLYMQPGRETAFLSKRKGFIRIAMQCGSAVVPCFAFGQSQTYKWLRLGPPLLSDASVQALSRRIGMVPMCLMGRWGTPVPYPAAMTVAFGRPIEVPHTDRPSEQLLQEYLERFISAMQELFEQHKAAAGYADCQLLVM